MKRLIKDGDPLAGTVSFSMKKAFRNLTCLLIGATGLIYFKGLSATLAAATITFLTMYVGVVAYHRLLIHRSFATPQWVEYLLVTFANLAGMGGPITLVHIHDTRDWAQRQVNCHPYFAHKHNIFVDGFQQLFCKIELHNAPQFDIELEKDSYYRHLEKYWLLYQLPLGALLYLAGGWAWICGGIFFKLFAVQFGHWLIAYHLHHYGKQPTIIKGAGAQGYNIPLLAIFTFGESYHNNHHLCPNAAKNSFRKGEVDPAWWLILLLKKMHLAHKVITFQKGSPMPTLKP